MRTRGPSATPVGHVTIGQIVGPQGLQGGLRVECLTDFPERFTKGRTVYVGGVPRKILMVSWHKTQARIEIEGVSTVEEAEAQKWVYITIPAEDRPKLGKGEFIATDLIGLTAYDQNEQVIGRVEDVLPSPAHSLLVIAGALVPAVRAFVKEIDIDKQRVTINVIPGLFEEDQA